VRSVAEARRFTADVDTYVARSDARACGSHVGEGRELEVAANVDDRRTFTAAKT
jgi:hypothetical protein